MAMKRFIPIVLVAILLSMSTPTLAQYEEEPFIEGYIGPNYTLPMGHLKNDLVPDSLNATSGIGLDAGLGYYYKSNLIIGGYFRFNNMGVDMVELSHRVFAVGLYSKFFLADITEGSGSPYLKVSAGLNFNKFATKVEGETTPTFRELSYSSTPAVEFSLGYHIKTTEAGAIYLEGAYGYDFSDGATGEFRSQKTEWGANNQFIILRVGVLFNIGPNE